MTNLTKRIIPCLDVKDGVVVKGVKFKNHVVLGGIEEMAQRYRQQGADELVFYDITASAEKRSVDPAWVAKTASFLDIPFCVAGGIRSVEDARRVFHAGADKISINSPAIERPELINELVEVFGSQAVVIGIDSTRVILEDGSEDYHIWKYTGSEATATSAGKRTVDWVKEVEKRGAGEIVLNCMDADGTRDGYDIQQLKLVRQLTTLPIIASGGAGKVEDFVNIFRESEVDGALAAGVFHRGEITVPSLKEQLKRAGIKVRPSQGGQS